MKFKTLIATSSMLIMSVIGGYSQSVFAFTGPLYVDTSFGVNGTALVDLIPDQDGNVYHISTGVAANNKVVTLTGIEMFNTDRKVYALAGFDDQGNPDSGFGAGGKVILSNLYLLHHEAHEMVVQADGKIIVVGRANTHVSGSEEVFAARYLANGSLDTSYGNNGIAIYSFLPESQEILEFGIHAVVQSNGRVIVATNVKSSYGENIFLFRFGSNGSSSNFNGGYVSLPGRGIIMDMDVDDQNRVVVVGGYSSPGSYFLNEKIFVARFTANLLPDYNGFSPYCTSPYDSSPCAYTILNVYDTHLDLTNQQFVHSNYQMDVALKKPYGCGTYNKIVVSGSFGIVRLNEDGTEDTGFKATGRVQNDLQFVDSVTPGYNYVEVRSDGKIVSLNNQSSTLALYRKDGQIALKCTGIESVDIPNNQTITSVFEPTYKNYSMKIDSKDRVVLGGAAIVSDDDFNIDIESAFVERYKGRCHLLPVSEVEGDPTTKMTIRDVRPFVHPQDIVGPEWKIRF